MELPTPAASWRRRTSVVIVGSGAAGLSAATHLAAAGVPTVVLTRGDVTAGATQWAQGGLAAAWAQGDSPEAHAADTMAAGAGLCEPGAVETLVQGAPTAIRRLIALGARFDTAADGDFDLHLEGGHGARRILHAGGDRSGAEVQSALVGALRRQVDAHGSTVSLVTGARVVDVLTDRDGAACGVRVREGDGTIGEWLASAVVLASGGIGQAWSRTSNPAVATGDGIAMSWRAGARLRDMEFVQFHPTVLHAPRTHGRDVLVSEAVRGEGAVLLDHAGHRVMLGAHPLADLAPRDVVAATMHARMAATGRDCLFLDARHFGARWAEQFPDVLGMLRARGIDPTTTPIPVRPGAHYLCGGVAADVDGRTSLPGLFAIGEVAATGAQGANRLASNSVTEALVTGGLLGARLAASRLPEPAPPLPRPTGTLTAPDEIPRLRATMDAHVGVVRDAEGLTAAIRALDGLRTTASLSDDSLDATAMSAVGGLVARAALARRESRGAHRRSDFPDAAPSWRHHLGITHHAITAEPLGTAPGRTAHAA